MWSCDLKATTTARQSCHPKATTTTRQSWSVKLDNDRDVRSVLNKKLLHKKNNNNNTESHLSLKLKFEVLNILKANANEDGGSDNGFHIIA